MTMKTHTGSCHCGAVRFEADIDLAAGTNRCNCSFCTKSRSWFVFVKPEAVRLLAGADAQTEYQWTPAGRPQPFLHHPFCSTCGVRTFGKTGLEMPGGQLVFVSVATLDGVSNDELAGAIKYVDGRNDSFESAPADTRLM